MIDRWDLLAGATAVWFGVACEAMAFGAEFTPNDRDWQWSVETSFFALDARKASETVWWYNHQETNNEGIAEISGPDYQKDGLRCRPFVVVVRASGQPAMPQEQHYGCKDGERWIIDGNTDYWGKVSYKPDASPASACGTVVFDVKVGPNAFLRQGYFCQDGAHHWKLISPPGFNLLDLIP